MHIPEQHSRDERETGQVDYNPQSSHVQAAAEILRTVGDTTNTQEVPAGGISGNVERQSKKKALSIIDFLGIGLLILTVYDVIKKQNYGEFIRIGLIGVILFGLYGIANNLMQTSENTAQSVLRRMSKAMPIFMILLVGSIAIGTIERIRPIATITLGISLVGVLFIFLFQRQYGYLLKPKVSVSETFEDKIKAELSLLNVKHYNPKFPKALNWVGGFMTPLFPFFTVANKNWKQNLSKEAYIHENMHIHLMVYEGWSVYIILGLLLFPFMLALLGFEGIVSDLLYFFFFAALLTTHERVTFEKTRAVGKKFDIECRPWSGKIARKYMFIYFTWIVVVNVIFELIKLLSKFIGGLF